MSKNTLIEEKVLPFERVKIEKQIDILKAFAILSARGKKSATYREVASLVGVNETNASACLKFWRSIKLLEKENKGYRASEVAMEFFRKLEWGDEEGAWSLMRDHLTRTWFGESVIDAFKLRSSMSEDDLINLLGSASRIVKRDSTTIRSLRLIVKLLEMSKIVIKDEIGNFKLNQKLIKELRKIEIKLPENKDVIKVTIGKKSFVVEVKALKEFVKKHGKELAEEEIVLD
ncbi:hypothetical protein J7L49_00090 [Candidatus Bathyarchaeota archaeon]|nr:hypothetical protein [Candidatus Bathyarchaeota archaeon]